MPGPSARHSQGYFTSVTPPRDRYGRSDYPRSAVGHVPNHGHECPGIERLREVPVETDRQEALSVAREGVGGERNNWDPPVGLGLPELFDQVLARHVGSQINVHEDGVG